MDTANQSLPVSEEFTPPVLFDFDNAALTDLVSYQKKNNPQLKGKSNKDIAEACGMSENTLWAILKGKNKNPRVGTLVCILKTIGGGSIDRLVGLAPRRDFAKEDAFYDATIVESLNVRLAEKAETILSLRDQLAASEQDRDRLRKLYNEKCIALSAAETRVESMKAEVAERNKYRGLRIFAAASIAALVVSLFIIIYLLW